MTGGATLALAAAESQPRLCPRGARARPRYVALVSEPIYNFLAARLG